MKQHPNKLLVVIVGPTASGKTALAIQLAKEFNTEIISADSRQFYKEMSIGTAKPSVNELKDAPHHFISHLSVTDKYSVGRFEIDALNKIKELHFKSDVAILVGGSGLYTDVICNGMDNLPETNEHLRDELNQRLENKGIDDLLQELKKLDPEYYNEVDRNNPHRVMRGIEVCISSGKKYSELRKSSSKQRAFDIIKIGIQWDREALYNRINNRVDKMIQEGLESEVRELLTFRDLNALRTVGYRELIEYIDNNCSLDEAIGKIKQHTRNFAKRQLTWYRKDQDINWITPNNSGAAIELIRNRIEVQP